MSKRPSWVAVFWEQDQMFSIQKASCVIKEEMLSDPTLVDLVEHQGNEKAKPAAGWDTFPGRVIASGSKFLHECIFQCLS